MSSEFSSRATVGQRLSVTVDDLGTSRHVLNMVDSVKCALQGFPSNSGYLALNLTNVRAVNSQGIAGLISVCRLARKRGVRLQLIPSPNVRRWLAVYRLQSLVGQ